MSDERLRELERRFKETGSVEDEAAWLGERVRIGDLDEKRLRLAGYLGHPAALACLGVSQATWRTLWDEDLPGWIFSLESFGREALVRAGLAIAHAAEEHVEEAPSARTAELLAAVEAWCREPDELLASRAWELSSWVLQEGFEGTSEGDARLALLVGGIGQAVHCDEPVGFVINVAADAGAFLSEASIRRLRRRRAPALGPWVGSSWFAAPTGG